MNDDDSTSDADDTRGGDDPAPRDARAARRHSLMGAGESKEDAPDPDPTTTPLAAGGGVV
jgi:hypothetical protein